MGCFKIKSPIMWCLFTGSVLIGITCFCYGQNLNSSNTEKTTKNQKFLPIEIITTDLNGDEKKDSIILTNPPLEGDPGVFQKLTLSFSGLGNQEFIAKDVWDSIDIDFLKNNQNAVKSTRVFVYKEFNRVLILLFGFSYGSGREEFTIIQIKENKTKIIFDEKLEHAIKLKDFDNDKSVELLGRNSGEIYQKLDSLNADIGTYNPFLIYKLSDTCKTDIILSKKYNENNYVWAGLEYNEEIKVLYPRDKSKPIIYK